jgi:hypothetical protein
LFRDVTLGWHISQLLRLAASDEGITIAMDGVAVASWLL